MAGGTVATPTGITYQKVVGQFISYNIDSNDADTDPDFIGLQGTVTFVPLAGRIRLGGEVPPKTLIPAPFTLTLDATGSIVSPDGSLGVWIVATGDDNIGIANYSVIVNLTGQAPYTVTITAPAGPNPVDLSTAVELDPATPPTQADWDAVIAQVTAEADRAVAAGGSMRDGVDGTNATITGASATGLAAGQQPTVTLGGTESARTFAFGIPAGQTGTAGTNGTNGTNGAAGTNATITGATASGLAAGATPTVTAGGTSSARTFAFGIPAGADGATGASGTIVSVSATGLPAGNAPTVTAGGTASARTFAFAIPAGTAGANGSNGTNGADATIVSASATGLTVGSVPTVTLGGTAGARTFAFGIPVGATGAAGADAAITGATVTGLAAGASPTVSLGGTSGARTFAFGIPAGANGTNGTNGTNGVDGSGRMPVTVITTTASTSTAIGSGSKTIDGITAHDFVVGNVIRASFTATPTTFMSGPVTAVTATSVTFLSDALFSGTGSAVAWTVTLSGSTGAKGATGTTGTTGAAGTITSATASGLAAGAAPTITLGGTTTARTFAFGIPAGAAGTNGTNGTNGADATITSASASSLAVGSSATVTLGGTAGARTFAFGIPVGATGANGTNGTNGSTGPAGTITGATASSISSGATPTVTLGGTSTARTFAFGIPAGVNGTNGLQPLILGPTDPVPGGTPAGTIILRTT